MQDFKGKTVVITGAASGIGYALAQRSAREGMEVVLADVEEGALISMEKDIKEIGPSAIAVKTDVSRAEDVQTLAEKTINAFGEVHLLFNNAGLGWEK